jgi:hypothetical protein
MSRLLLLLLLLLLGSVLALTGCARVGRGLVGELEAGGSDFDGGPLRIVGCKMPSCADAGAAIAEFEAVPLGELDWSGCDDVAEDTGALADGAELSCTRLRVRLDDAPLESAPMRLHDLRLEQAELSLEASSPTQVILEAAYLDRVALTLQGPVTLHLVAPSELRDVTVRGTASAAGAPGLHLERHAAAALYVGSPEQRFAGSVTLERVAVTDSQIVAEQLRLESTTFYDGLIDAAVVSTADTDLDTVELRVGDGQIAAGRVRRLQVARCGRLELLGVESNNAWYTACSDGPLRVYNSAIFGGHFDGAIESELTVYSRARFGGHQPTNLTLWSGTLQSCAFCEHTGATVFNGVASCVACEPEVFAEPGVLCHPQSATEYIGNFCQAFEQVPACDVLPERPRPRQGRKPEDRLP